jgi:CubicO group peptidase (beta-lactamase class C family)
LGLFTGGLVTTATDWLKMQFSLLHGSPLLNKRTIEFMLRNHVEKVFPPTPFDASQKGYGSALGCFLQINPAQTGRLTSPGECFTGGFLGTYSSIDRQEQIAIVFMTQRFGFDFDVVHRIQSVIMANLLD